MRQMIGTALWVALALLGSACSDNGPDIAGQLAGFSWDTASPRLWSRENSGNFVTRGRTVDAIGNGVGGVPVAVALRRADGNTSPPTRLVSDFGGYVGVSIPVTRADSKGDFYLEASLPELGTFKASHAVKVIDFFFITGDGRDYLTGNKTTVKQGTMVRWAAGEGTMDHFIVPGDGSVPGGPVTRTRVFGHRFDTPGTYSWYCSLHTVVTDWFAEGEEFTTVIVEP
jgi:hypothetical protein